MIHSIIIIVFAALSSLIIRLIWYNPKVFGTIWMKETGIVMNENRKPNMGKILLVNFIYAFLIAICIPSIVIHQSGATAMIGGPLLLKEALPSFTAFMNDYGTSFRTLKHGALHGFMMGLFFVLSIVGVNALYEGKSFKYVLVTAGYWGVSLGIMGAIICQWF